MFKTMIDAGKKRRLNKEERQTLVRVSDSLGMNIVDHFESLDKVGAEKLPEYYEAPAVGLTEHGAYKPVKIEPEYIDAAVPYGKLRVGTTFWSWRHRLDLHTDGSVVFDTQDKVHTRPQSSGNFIKLVKLDKAVAGEAWDVRNVGRDNHAYDKSSSLANGRHIPVVCIEHVRETVNKELRLEDHSE